MSMRSLRQLAAGYVTAELRGGFAQRLLSEALRSGPALWDIRTENGAVRFAVAARDYKKLRPLAKRAQCRLRVAEKHGLAFALRRVRHPAGRSAPLRPSGTP